MAGVQNINIDISDTNTMQYIYAVKNDVGRTINFIINNGTTAVKLTGGTGTFIVSKSNGAVISLNTTNKNNVASITETTSLTSLSGVHKFELEIVNSSGTTIVDINGYYVVVPDVIANTSVINEYSDNLIDLLVTEFASLKVNMDHLRSLETDLVLRNGGDISNTVTNDFEECETDGSDKWYTVQPLVSGEKTSVSMSKISKMIANIKYLEKLYESLSFAYDSDNEDLVISMDSVEKN